MGQYHAIYNLTKKEYISPHAFNDGSKLMEMNNILTALAVLLANSNGRGGGDLRVYPDYGTDGKTKAFTAEQKAGQAAIDAIAGRWAGDKIVVQGDYAETGDAAFISEKRLQAFTSINDIVRKALETDEYMREQLKADW